LTCGLEINWSFTKTDKAVVWFNKIRIILIIWWNLHVLALFVLNVVLKDSRDFREKKSL